MSLSRKLKLALLSSPATEPLIKYLEETDIRISSIIENGSTGNVYDDTEIRGMIGEVNVERDGSLQSQINNLNMDEEFEDLLDELTDAINNL